MGMSQAAFARLCGISKMMVTKYAQQGFVIKNGQEVDTRASLQALAGRLDDGKRRRALAALDAGAIAPDHQPADDDARAAARPQPAIAASALSPDGHSWRVERDRTDTEIRKIELARLRDEVVDAATIAPAIIDAATAFGAELDRRQRFDADAFAATLKLTVEQAKELRALMKRRDDEVRRNFARSLRVAAEQIAAPKVNAA